MDCTDSADLALACRLLNACGAAYSITGTSFSPPSGNTCYDGILWGSGQPTPVVSGEDDIDAALVGSTTDGNVIVAFRGTLPVGSPLTSAELLDWTQDATLSPLSVSSLGSGVAVHPGFWAAVDAIYDQLVTTVKPLATSGTPLYFTGHSKGGPMATIAALRYASDKHGKPTVVTFASPMPGNSDFKTAFDAAGLTQTRFENDLDIVPFLPPSSLVATALQAYFKCSDPQPDTPEGFMTKLLCGVLNLAANEWDYQAVGSGCYIDSSGAVHSQTTGWEVVQTLNLSLAIKDKEFAQIAQAHCHGCPGSDCQGGYMTGVCPGSCPC